MSSFFLFLSCFTLKYALSRLNSLSIELGHNIEVNVTKDTEGEIQMKEGVEATDVTAVTPGKDFNVD